MNRSIISLLCLVVISCTTAQNPSNVSKPDQVTDDRTIEHYTRQMEKFSGYFNFYYDDRKGQIWLEVDKFNLEFLYVNSLPAGVGSNDIGLDRGQLGATRVVKFMRSGPKILLVQPNYDYRAISDNPEEQKSVEQAFAQSVIWGFDVKAETEWRALIDITPFLLRDAHGVQSRLMRTGQGTYKLDKSRSALYMPMTKNFPENSEFESTITFNGSPKGDWIRSVTPTPSSVTVRMHHSFIQLPDSRYKPRKFDPRAGYMFIDYQDYATPIDQPLVKRFIRRHRLSKKDPGAAVSEAIEPIIYYLDRGAPEPIKSALIEGASWWNQAFEAAGYKDAFQVKLLPEDADPMDIRYNLIQWVHRSTRGWSYGSSVYDPRTGEIIKGQVSLGSLRVRQDFLIAEGLLGPYEDGKEPSGAMLEMALARLRQLSAHEVGHTLGIIHNFAASVNDRASVMDYPHPYVKLDSQGKVDLSEAYDTGIGEWDKQVVKYGYSHFAEGLNEDEELEKIINENFSLGLLHISDSDARPQGGAHPVAHLWDNGTNPADELNRMMGIRAKILADFSENRINNNTPMSSLEEALVPMYLFHRYQIEGAAKMLGGLNYSFAVKNDGQVVTEMISPESQQKALDALLNTISPEALSLPENLLQKIPPRAFGYPRTRETFKVRTGVTFDALSITETAANMTLRFLLHPERASRLVEFNSRNNDQPGLGDVIDELNNSTWKGARSSGYQAEIQRVVEKLAMYHLIALARNDKASEQARAIAMFKLEELAGWINRQSRTVRDGDHLAHLKYCKRQIDNFLSNPESQDINVPISPPDGSPIGDGGLLSEELCYSN